MLEKWRGTRHMGAALGGHDGDGFIWVPMCHQDRGRTQQQRRFEGVDRSANMADGGRHQKAVAPFDQPMAADLADQRVDAFGFGDHLIQRDAHVLCAPPNRPPVVLI